MFLPGLIIILLIWAIYTIINDWKISNDIKKEKEKLNWEDEEKYYKSRNEMNELSSLNNWDSNNL